MRQISETTVLSINELEKDIFDLRVNAPDITAQALPGQFVTLYLNDPSKLLPRPMSICGIDRNEGILRMVFRISGKGTEILSGVKKGGTLKILGPLGNGFPLERAFGKRTAVIGGGIGIPPLLYLSSKIKEKCELTAVLGYRDVLYLDKEFEAETGQVIISTEDGSAGTKGNVIDAMNACGYEPEVIFACGPKPMFRALKQYAAERRIECWLSFEERMACGIGACLACVCKTVQTDSHSNVRNRRVCKDGPVFNAQEMEI